MALLRWLGVASRGRRGAAPERWTTLPVTGASTPSQSVPRRELIRRRRAHRRRSLRARVTPPPAAAPDHPSTVALYPRDRTRRQRRRGAAPAAPHPPQTRPLDHRPQRPPSPVPPPPPGHVGPLPARSGYQRRGQRKVGRRGLQFLLGAAEEVERPRSRSSCSGVAAPPRGQHVPSGRPWRPQVTLAWCVQAVARRGIANAAGGRPNARVGRVSLTRQQTDQRFVRVDARPAP